MHYYRGNNLVYSKSLPEKSLEQRTNYEGEWAILKRRSENYIEKLRINKLLMQTTMSKE